MGFRRCRVEAGQGGQVCVQWEVEGPSRGRSRWHLQQGGARQLAVCASVVRVTEWLCGKDRPTATLLQVARRWHEQAAAVASHRAVGEGS